MAAHPTLAIFPEESVWKDPPPELKLPKDMTASEVWEKHAKKDLVGVGWSRSLPKQIVPHRGISNYAGGIADLSLRALLDAASGSVAATGNTVELDVLWIGTDQQPSVMHDLTGVRQTTYQGEWSTYRQPSGRPGPDFILRNVKEGHYTNKYVPAKQAIIPLVDCLNSVLSKNPKASFFLDGRNQDGARLTAFLRLRQAYANNSVVQIYPYTNRSADDFIRDTERFIEISQDRSATIGWKRLVKIAPILNADTLHLLAEDDAASIDYKKLFKAGQDWLSSMMSAELTIFGLGLPASGIGRNVDLNTMTVKDLKGRTVTDHATKASFVKDRVLLDLMEWAKQTYQQIPVIGVCITYSYQSMGRRYTNSFHTGQPILWEKGAASHGKKQMSIPGNPFELGADIAIVDRPLENLMHLTGTCTYRYPDDVNYPPNNATVEDQ